MPLEINQIHHGDCLQLMNDIPDKSIDSIICDLPYGVTKNKWDSVINLPELWIQYKRIIKDNGAIILFSQGLFTAKLQFSNENWYKYDLIWEKDRPSGFLNAKKMPLRSHEQILFFYKSPPTYNPIMWDGKKNNSIGKSIILNNNNNYGNFNYKDSRDDLGKSKYPRSVLYYNRPHPPIHPTQKPIELLEYLINTYTNEGDLVLDNCIGSGTTAIACKRTNRNFIGIEKEQKYFDIANKRLNETLF